MSDTETLQDGDGLLLKGKSDSPPELLQRLLDQLEQLAPEAIPTGVRFLRGKADQEWAKAHQIKVQAITEIGRLELEQDRLAAQVRKDDREADQRALNDARAHVLRKRELQIMAVKAVAEIIEAAARSGNVGVQVDISLVTKSLLGITGGSENA